MIDSLTPAARLPQTDPDQAHAVAHAEGRATLELLRTLGSDDWARPTDCTDWDVRALVAHLVAQCQDGIHLASMARRELLGRRRYPDKSPLDAYMAVGVDDHRAASGPQLVERFARLWPRAARARRRRPAVLRRLTLDPGIPGQPRWRLDYLLDVIYNRDLWMHRIDLARATGRPFILGDHDRQIVAQVVRDLARGWSAAPVAGCWGPATRWRSSGPRRSPTCALWPAATTTWSWSWSLGRRPRSPPSARPESSSDRRGLCLRLLQGVEADQRARQLHEPQHDVGAPLVAHLQAPVAHQPRQRPLHHIPVAAQPLAGLDATPGDPRGDPASAQRPPATWVVIALVAVQLGGPLPGRPRLPPGPLIAGTASTMASSSTESWVLAADSPTAKGMPRRSTSRWYLDPGLPRSVGFGPVSSPPVWRAR
jgi:uncharacterized protein (TIGR03083 family)